MWTKPTQQSLAQIPKLYATENIPVKEKLIYLHFFLSNSDWYVCEFDGADTFFGYVILNGDYQAAEWGYFTIHKLDRLNVRGLEIDMDLYWEIRPASQIDKISQAQGWNQQPNPLNQFNTAVL
ncbi:DUF2958 domain-containing protein [Desulfopila sp. IMCC35008]|uniref:DUF2958 domain-containing protein n=1 Tax=Desulfopila sp. IMCC35008 TaxID=2653858 RepID=UPI0013D61311|nr:DUF2958 domain-containing protein [Desulfopila sp. IMCC35008]